MSSAVHLEAAHLYRCVHTGILDQDRKQDTATAQHKQGDTLHAHMYREVAYSSYQHNFQCELVSGNQLGVGTA